MTMKAPSRSSGPAYARAPRRSSPRRRALKLGDRVGRDQVTAPSRASSPPPSRADLAPPMTGQRGPQLRHACRTAYRACRARGSGQSAAERQTHSFRRRRQRASSQRVVATLVMGVSESFQRDSSAPRDRREGGRAVGPRALLRAAHPVAFAGFFAHTGARQALQTTGHGSRARPRRVRPRRGRPPRDAPGARCTVGCAARPRQPDLRGQHALRGGRSGLLLWILAALADSAAVVYQRCVTVLSAGRGRCGPTIASSGVSSACASRHALGVGRLPGLCARHGRGRGPASPTRAARGPDRRARRFPLRMRPVLKLANRSRSACCRRACAPVRRLGRARGRVRGGRVRQRFVVPFLPERLRVVRSARRAVVLRRACGALRGSYCVTVEGVPGWRDRAHGRPRPQARYCKQARGH
jgi:hypothetical protein